MTTRMERIRLRLADATAPADGLTGSASLDALEWVSRWITLAAYVAAVIVFVAAPILALAWANLPFPGFTIEPTLIVNDARGEAWTGHKAGIRYPMHLLRVDGLPVTTAAEYHAILSNHAVGDRVPIITQLPDGNLELYPRVELIRFPRADLTRLFWVPYLVGLAYLVIGIWVYSLRGRTRPGRALSFFCVTTAVSCALLFDLSTTHAAPVIWTLAVAQLGGALISLALRFPEEWKPVHWHPWLLTVPYAVSIVLGAWGIGTLRFASDPRAYIDAWGASYRFAAFGSLVFLITMLYRARSSPSADIRRQARIVVFGSTLAFAPIVTWFLAPLFNLALEFSAPLLLLPILIFPASLTAAIMRYRLWAVDQLVNRTLVYATMTALLAGLYTACIGLSQRIFVAVTGEKSDAAIVMTTLIVASAITPVRSWLQAFVDQQFKDERTENQALRALRDEVQAFGQFTDARRLAGRLLDGAARDLGAACGVVSLLEEGEPRIVSAVGNWRGDARLSLPLESDGQWIGLIQLGPRLDGRTYTRSDVDGLLPTAGKVADAIAWATRVSPGKRSAETPPG